MMAVITFSNTRRGDRSRSYKVIRDKIVARLVIALGYFQMETETKNTCMVVINVFLLGAVLWYAAETRWLRQQNVELVEQTEMQARLAVLPYVVPDVFSINQLRQIKDTLTSSTKNLASRKKIPRALRNPQITQVVRAKNLSTHPARSVTPVIFIDHKGKYRLPETYNFHVRAKEFAIFLFEDKWLSREELSNKLEETYSYKKWGEILSSDNGSFVLLVYEGVRGTIYIHKQFLVFSGADVYRYKGSDFKTIETKGVR